MKTYLAILCAVSTLFVPTAPAQTAPPLKLVATMPMPNLEGYLDHMSVDLKGQRLFVPGEYQQTLQIIDLRSGKVLRSITGFGGHPRTAIYLPTSNEIWVDDADGSCKVFSGDSYELIRTIELTGLGKDPKKTPDNATYDSASGLLYVAVTVASSAGPETNRSVLVVGSGATKNFGALNMGGKKPPGVSTPRGTPN